MTELKKNPFEIFGDEEAFSVAEDILLLDTAALANQRGLKRAASGLLHLATPRKDGDGNVSVNLKGIKIDLGHVSKGLERIS